MKQEIKSSDWPAFFQRLAKQEAGALVKLETFGTDGIKTVQVESAEFESLLFDQTAGCNDIITLRFRNNREIVHEIVEPIRIALHPSGGQGDFNPLEIIAENGVFIITFHPAIHSQLLDELKTA